MLADRPQIERDPNLDVVEMKIDVLARTHRPPHSRRRAPDLVLAVFAPAKDCRAFMQHIPAGGPELNLILYSRW